MSALMTIQGHRHPVCATCDLDMTETHRVNSLTDLFTCETPKPLGLCPTLAGILPVFPYSNKHNKNIPNLMPMSPDIEIRLDHHTTGCWINKHGTQWACAWNASQWRVQRDGWQHLVDVVDVYQVLRVDSFFYSSLLFSGTFVVFYPLFSLLSSYFARLWIFFSQLTRYAKACPLWS